MGPNLYITPPGTFTHFHQDGHGTVDSGHQCLRGRNEVVMLRRMDEPNKRRALRILCKGCPSYDALYGKPHDAGEKPPWPTETQIDELRRHGYCPSVFTLEPGDYVHINKGRLHAFRKRSPPPGSNEPEQFCVSVAWDWLYQGSSAKALEDEVAEPLACAEYNHKKRVPSLAHTETALLHAAAAAEVHRQTEPGGHVSRYHGSALLSPADMSIGIKAAFKSLKTRESSGGSRLPEEDATEAHRKAETNDIQAHHMAQWTRAMTGGDSVEAQCPPIAAVCHGLVPPNLFATEPAQDPSANGDGRARSIATDPYTCDPYVCSFCQQELASSYFQCVGCRELLATTLNVCNRCVKNADQFTPTLVKRSTDRIHCRPQQSANPCKCHNALCSRCGKCPSCECGCHTIFEHRSRFDEV